MYGDKLFVEKEFAFMIAPIFVAHGKRSMSWKTNSGKKSIG